MRVFMIISAFVVLAYGRPETPSGYQYPSPGRSSQSNSYSAPSASVGFSDSRSGISATARLSSQRGFSSSSASASSSLSGGSFGASGAHGRQGGFSSGHNGHDQSGDILVHKHIYVHVPPAEHDEEHQHRAQVHVPPPQKHYKIIFIKAPSAAATAAPIIPPLPQNEEKTIVYVLVKKPEEQHEIVIPTSAPTEPSRPEVYFIRYKAQKEDSHSHDQGVAGHDDFSQDDTVEVGARQGGGYSRGGSAQNSAQSSGLSSSFSSSASVSSSGASARLNVNGVSSQYGVPRSSGPY